uniref:Uncharacterized protein n=1 Tax=Tetranychus urticae TaxID=32264 RepID=T1JYY7_TETUR
MAHGIHDMDLSFYFILRVYSSRSKPTELQSTDGPNFNHWINNNLDLNL